MAWTEFYDVFERCFGSEVKWIAVKSVPMSAISKQIFMFFLAAPLQPDAGRDAKGVPVDRLNVRGVIRNGKSEVTA